MSPVSIFAENPRENLRQRSDLEGFGEKEDRYLGGAEGRNSLFSDRLNPYF